MKKNCFITFFRSHLFDSERRRDETRGHNNPKISTNPTAGEKNIRDAAGFKDNLSKVVTSRLKAIHIDGKM